MHSKVPANVAVKTNGRSERRLLGTRERKRAPVVGNTGERRERQLLGTRERGGSAGCWEHGREE
eukprot:353088-Chlamydomonas_euryale.AAC.2